MFDFLFGFSGSVGDGVTGACPSVAELCPTVASGEGGGEVGVTVSLDFTVSLGAGKGGSVSLSAGAGTTDSGTMGVALGAEGSGGNPLSSI